MIALPILGQEPAEPPRGVAILRLAFRPFYLLAALAGAVLMPLWLAVFTGSMKPVSGLAPVLWHAHEMIFGMASAVVVGFLFTAGKTWTGLPTPRGAQLLFLAALWLSGRISAMLAPPAVFFLLDIAFLPLSAAFFAEVLLRADNRRNFIVAMVLGILGAANIAFHLAVHKILPFDPVRALHAGLCVLLLMETLIGGRVIPFFTRNVTPGLSNTVEPWRERLLGVVTVLALLLWLTGIARPLIASLLLAAAILHAWRLWTWRPSATWRKPILWSLHLAYAWIPIGFLLLAWATISNASPSAAMHAFAVGATGGLLIAMMTRTARGHTGRPLQTGSAEVIAYVLVAIAAVVRVLAPILWPALYPLALVLAGGCFSLAFCVYVWVYGPWLFSTRADGKDG